MKTAISWFVSIVTANLIQEALNAWLPADMSRVWVIAIAGAATIPWYLLIVEPLHLWSKS